MSEIEIIRDSEALLKAQKQEINQLRKRLTFYEAKDTIYKDDFKHIAKLDISIINRKMHYDLELPPLIAGFQNSVDIVIKNNSNYTLDFPVFRSKLMYVDSMPERIAKHATINRKLIVDIPETEDDQLDYEHEFQCAVNFNE